MPGGGSDRRVNTRFGRSTLRASFDLSHLAPEYLVEQRLGAQLLLVGPVTEELQHFRIQVHREVNDGVLVIELANLTLGEIEFRRQLIHIRVTFHGAFHH